jgi:hypothetical protein
MLLKFDLVHSQHLISLLIAFYWRHFGILCLFCNSQGICVSRGEIFLISSLCSYNSTIRHGFVPGFVNYNKGCTWLSAASDKVYQWLAHGRWFSLGTPASSTTKTGRHDIAESGVKHQKSIKKNQSSNQISLSVPSVVSLAYEFDIHFS